MQTPSEELRPLEALRQRLMDFNTNGYDSIAGATYQAEDTPISRKFRGKELARVVGVPDVNMIRDAEQSGALPRPSRSSKGGRQSSLLSDVLVMQEYFGTRPWRHPDDPPAIIAFTNFKGGCWKTTTSWYAGSFFANQGFRVLLVDVDPQASLTLNCGLLPDIEVFAEHTLALHLKDESPEPVSSLVQKTYLPNMDIIPASLELSTVELRLSSDMMVSPDFVGRQEILQRLQKAIRQVQDDYDVIIMDGTPSLGVLTMNIIAASNIVIAPVPTELTDFASTLSFCELVAEQLEGLDLVMRSTGEDIQAPDVFFQPTRYSPEGTKTYGSAETLLLIQEVFGDFAFPVPIKKHDAAVSNLSIVRRTAFDVNSANPQCGSRARNAAVENFGEVFQHIFDRAIKPKWQHGTDYLRATEELV